MKILCIIFFGSVLLYQNEAKTGFEDLTIVSDLLPEDCFQIKQDYVNADKTDGLPKCQKFKRPTICSKYRNTASVVYGKIVSKPTCDKDGTFAAKQCKGDKRTGRCFCFDSEGKRLFGQQWWKDADDMTCACSRRKADMQLLEDPPYFNSLHCNSLGNYEPLQCDMTSEQCWCAEEKTGDLKSPVVPIKVMTKLPCYETLKIGTQYLRQCESKKYAQGRILYELSLHGTAGSTFGDFLCDDDGSYGAYKVVSGSAYCTWRDNTNIGPWQYSGNDRGNLTCNCAKDSVIFQRAGRVQSQECTGGGNYEAYQTLGGSPYCVDIDGYRKTPPDAKPKSNTECDAFPAYNKL